MAAEGCRTDGERQNAGGRAVGSRLASLRIRGQCSEEQAWLRAASPIHRCKHLASGLRCRVTSAHRPPSCPLLRALFFLFPLRGGERTFRPATCLPRTTSLSTMTSGTNEKRQFMVAPKVVRKSGWQREAQG